MTTRRTLLKFIGASAATSVLSCTPLERKAGSSARAFAPEVEAFLARSGPIDRTNSALDVFSGDNFNHLAHDHIPGAPGGPGAAPAASDGWVEDTAVVVIGGGLSGLFSAWCLRQHRPVVLERASRFGGNSKGESWNGIDYSIGAAYFAEPDQGTELYKLFHELGFPDMCRLKTDDDPVLLNGRRYAKFWDGETDPGNASQFRALRRHFKEMLDEKNGL